MPKTNKPPVKKFTASMRPELFELLTEFCQLSGISRSAYISQTVEANAENMVLMIKALKRISEGNEVDLNSVMAQVGQNLIIESEKARNDAS